MDAHQAFMEQETNDGVAYLKALKQSTAPGAADARARTADSPAQAQAQNAERFQGAEKRRSPRYKCEGSAQIRENGCTVHTWASFTDVSLHGCYVEAQATYPVGTVLHMKLEANGVRVETKGSVRVTYPSLGMGIAFTDMPEETLARLKEMLATISRQHFVMGPGIAADCKPASEGAPLITNPTATIQALIEFFENRQMLMRDEFLRILRKSQIANLSR